MNRGYTKKGDQDLALLCASEVPLPVLASSLFGKWNHYPLTLHQCLLFRAALRITTGQITGANFFKIDKRGRKGRFHPWQHDI